MEKRTINLYLVRHGETDWNRNETIQGSQNISLNSTGIRQAEETAEILKNYNIDYIYSSPLNRAFETAEIIAKSKNILDVKKVDGIQEVCFGKLEGSSKVEFFEKNKIKFYKYLFSNEKFEYSIINNCEQKNDICKRFMNAFCNVCNNTKYKNILIVSHYFVLKLFLEINNFNLTTDLKNCCIISCTYKNCKFNDIKLLNQK